MLIPAPSPFPSGSGSLLVTHLWDGRFLSAEVPVAAMSLPGCAAWHKELLIHWELPAGWAAGIVTLCLLLPLFLKTKSLRIPDTPVELGDAWNEGPECGTNNPCPLKRKAMDKCVVNY